MIFYYISMFFISFIYFPLLLLLLFNDWNFKIKEKITKEKKIKEIFGRKKPSALRKILLEEVMPYTNMLKNRISYFSNIASLKFLFDIFVEQFLFVVCNNLYICSSS